MNEAFPDLKNYIHFDDQQMTLARAIWTQNDYHRKSREEIADWVEAQGF